MSDIDTLREWIEAQQYAYEQFTRRGMYREAEEALQDLARLKEDLRREIEADELLKDFH